MHRLLHYRVVLPPDAVAWSEADEVRTWEAHLPTLLALLPVFSHNVIDSQQHFPLMHCGAPQWSPTAHPSQIDGVLVSVRVMVCPTLDSNASPNSLSFVELGSGY